MVCCLHILEFLNDIYIRCISGSEHEQADSEVESESDSDSDSEITINSDKMERGVHTSTPVPWATSLRERALADIAKGEDHVVIEMPDAEWDYHPLTAPLKPKSD